MDHLVSHLVNSCALSVEIFALIKELVLVKLSSRSAYKSLNSDARAVVIVFLDFVKVLDIFKLDIYYLAVVASVNKLCGNAARSEWHDKKKENNG